MTESNGPPNSDPMCLSAEQIKLARARIREWPLEERQSLTRMSEREARVIMFLTAELDLRPVPADEPDANAVLVDLRSARYR